jgi:hypothetical protein
MFGAARFHAVAPALLLLLLLEGCGDGVEPPVSATRLGRDDPLAAAIDRIVEYLSPRRLEHDELWFVHQASARLGPPFPAWARTLRPVGEPEQAERVLAATRDLELPALAPLGRAPRVTPAPVEPFTESHGASLNVIARLLELAATCSPESAHDVDQMRGLTGVRTHGYVLGHQAWALRVGAARGCLTGPEIERRRVAMARQLLAELLAGDAVTDLDVERGAALCLLDACHWVPSDWLGRLLAAQQSSGGWGDLTGPGVTPGTLREEHAVALAFYLLAGRLDGAERSPPEPGAG